MCCVRSLPELGWPCGRMRLRRGRLDLPGRYVVHELQDLLWRGQPLRDRPSRTGQPVRTGDHHPAMTAFTATVAWNRNPLASECFPSQPKASAVLVDEFVLGHAAPNENSQRGGWLLGVGCRSFPTVRPPSIPLGRRAARCQHVQGFEPCALPCSRSARAYCQPLDGCRFLGLLVLPSGRALLRLLPFVGSSVHGNPI
jgi:hypothetical protein